MEISKDQLRAVISRAIELFEQSNNSKRQANLLLSGAVDQRLEQFFNNQVYLNQLELNAVVTKEQIDDQRLCMLLTKHCRSITFIEDALNTEVMEELTIIPIMSLELLAKTALCIPDIMQVQWIMNAFQRGVKVEVMLSGLPNFTGKEPEAYKQRVLSYIRTLMEYGIEIKRMDGEVEE